MISQKFYFSGKVQGVGFRYTVRELASTLPVVGYVRNLSNGDVELLVKSDRDNIARLLEMINAKMANNITSVRQEACPDCNLLDFTIRN